MEPILITGLAGRLEVEFILLIIDQAGLPNVEPILITGQAGLLEVEFILLIFDQVGLPDLEFILLIFDLAGTEAGENSSSS